MLGTFSALPNSLEESLSCLASRCEEFDWAVNLQSGPFRQLHFTDPDDSRNLLDLFYDFPIQAPQAYFRRGVLPKHANDLVFDEWSYYFGFDASSISAEELHQQLGDDILPGEKVFELLKNTESMFLIHVDDGWWELFSANRQILECWKNCWNGRDVESSRWVDGNVNYPFPFD